METWESSWQRAVKNCSAFEKIKIYPAAETIRATVVGAGTHTTDVSGSTIRYAREKLPIKNIPVLKISEEDEENPVLFAEAVKKDWLCMNQKENRNSWPLLFRESIIPVSGRFRNWQPW